MKKTTSRFLGAILLGLASCSAFGQANVQVTSKTDRTVTGDVLAGTHVVEATQPKAGSGLAVTLSGMVPSSRTINGVDLSANLSLADLGLGTGNDLTFRSVKAGGGSGAGFFALAQQTSTEPTPTSGVIRLWYGTTSGGALTWSVGSGGAGTRRTLVAPAGADINFGGSFTSVGAVTINGPGTITKSGTGTTTIPDGTLVTTTDLATKEPSQSAASQVEAEAGTGTGLRSWTPQRVAQAISSQVPPMIGSATAPIIGFDPANVTSGWATVVDDNFTRSNTTPPASIGSPATYASPSVGGAWADASTLWKILGNQLVPSTTNPNGGPTGPRRPSAENLLNQWPWITTGPLPVSADTALLYTLCMRAGVNTASYDSSYFARLLFNPSAQTATLYISSARSTSPVQAQSSSSFAVVSGHSYILSGKAESLYPGGFTILRATVADAAAPGTVLARMDSTSIPMFAATCSAASAVGIIQERSDIFKTQNDVITRFVSQKKLTNVLTGIAAPLVTSTSGNWISVSGSGNFVAGTPGSPIFKVTNLAGCSITDQVVISPQLARIKITTGSTAGTLRIVDPSSGGTYDVAVAASTTEPLMVTNLVPVESTATTVKIFGGLVTGGKAPYSFQWYRSTAWDAAPGTAISGATSIDLIDTPPDDQLYSYKLVVTDSTSGTPLTATSPSAPGMRNWRAPPTAIYQPTNPIGPVKLGYIGDSITQSSGTVAPFEAALARAGVTVTSSTNMAVSGSYTGAPGNGWMPDSSSGILTAALSAFNSAGVTHIMLMLGTNDTAAFGVSKATYITNLNTILTKIAEILPGIPVIINTPPLATGGVSADANVLGISYVDALDQIVAANPNAVRGDRYAMAYFYGRYDLFADEIHPNGLGVTKLGEYWAQAFLKAFDRPPAVDASGTAYSLTTSSAALDFGTRDPVLTLGKRGNYTIQHREVLKYNGATFAAAQTATFKVRRTNRAAADLDISTATVPLSIVSSTTGGAGVTVKTFTYHTDSDGDVITIYGGLSGAPSPGSLDVIEASLVAAPQ